MKKDIVDDFVCHPYEHVVIFGTLLLIVIAWLGSGDVAKWADITSDITTIYIFHMFLRQWDWAGYYKENKDA